MRRSNIIPVTTPKSYAPDVLHVTVRRDLNRANGWAFIVAPNYFCADVDQLRQLADACHDLADQLDK